MSLLLWQSLVVATCGCCPWRPDRLPLTERWLSVVTRCRTQDPSRLAPEGSLFVWAEVVEADWRPIPLVLPAFLQHATPVGLVTSGNSGTGGTERTRLVSYLVRLVSPCVMGGHERRSDTSLHSIKKPWHHW